MRLRRLALAAIAGLAIFPMSGAMAASPGTTDLPQALANPVEPDFVETTSNRSGELVGYFDAGAFAQWAGTDARSRQAFRDMLTSRGFVTGYQRIWSSNREVLFETVFVFRAPGDAESMLSSVKSGFTASDSYKGPVPINLDDTAWAGEEIVNGFHWTAAGFTKANDAFTLYRGSDVDYRTKAALAQAREMYTIAPNGTALGPQAAQQSMLSRYMVPVLITFAVGALLIAAALVIAVIVTLVRPRPQAAAADFPARP